LCDHNFAFSLVSYCSLLAAAILCDPFILQKDRKKNKLSFRNKKEARLSSVRQHRSIDSKTIFYYFVLAIRPAASMTTAKPTASLNELPQLMVIAARFFIAPTLK
jgi:hypothetical protein